MGENVKKNDQNGGGKSEETVVMGPALPSHLKKVYQEESLKQEEIESREETLVIGPALPPHMLKSLSQEPDDVSEEKGGTSVIGPQLPSHMLTKNKSDTQESAYIGPQLPSYLRHELENVKGEEEEEDEEVYGPLPVGEGSYSKTQIALEERALQLKMDQLESKDDKAPVREEWMLELPEVRAAKLGLGPRQFKTKSGPDFSDRSSWTDTPNKKAKKEEVNLKKEAEVKEIQRRNEEQERISKKHKKKNKESLLEMHQTEMKKKKKEEGGQSERRPFSRDIDLQVNRFDEAQKKAILKKAQLLDDRFSSGQSKFL